MTAQSKRWCALVAALVTVIGVAAVTPRPAAADPPKELYAFFENTDRYVSFVRGKWLYIGKFDKNGDFTEELKFDADVAFLSAGIPPTPGWVPMTWFPERRTSSGPGR
jgi:hypothetical protein